MVNSTEIIRGFYVTIEVVEVEQAEVQNCNSGLKGFAVYDYLITNPKCIPICVYLWAGGNAQVLTDPKLVVIPEGESYKFQVHRQSDCNLTQETKFRCAAPQVEEIYAASVGIKVFMAYAVGKGFIQAPDPIETIAIIYKPIDPVLVMEELIFLSGPFPDNEKN